jgi:hypothetical protein
VGDLLDALERDFRRVRRLVRGGSANERRPAGDGRRNEDGRDQGLASHGKNLNRLQASIT